jgi:dihydroneopterin aldolase
MIPQRLTVTFIHILDALDRISAVKVTVHKPHAPIAAIFEDVGVVLTRMR